MTQRQLDRQSHHSINAGSQKPQTCSTLYRPKVAQQVGESFPGWSENLSNPYDFHMLGEGGCLVNLSDSGTSGTVIELFSEF